MFKIDSYDFKGKRAIIRVDFNVPLDDEGRVTDDTRIRAAIPTIEKVLSGGGSVILMSHLGRPKKNPDPKYSLRQIVPDIERLLGRKVLFAGDCTGDEAARMARDLKPGEVMLLENLRFYAEEEGKPRGLADDADDAEKAEAKKAVKASQKEFVKRLASYADCYINDAFGTAHRAHASTAFIADYFPEDKMFGYVMENELKAIEGVMQHPQRPFCAIIGGSKVSTKISIIEKLMEKVDSIVIGGGMTYTFLKAQGGSIGKSLLEEDWLDYCNDMMKKAQEKGVKLLLPEDTVCAKEFSADAEPMTVDSMHIPDDCLGMDIGPKAIAAYSEAVKDAGTVIWNGPMGVFEFPAFAAGTKAVAEALSKSSAITIIGGGDSAAAVQQLGYADRMTHISTGGGASLEFMEGKELPGVACLLDA